MWDRCAISRTSSRDQSRIDACTITDPRRLKALRRWCGRRPTPRRRGHARRCLPGAAGSTRAA
jgi:hypothetical protein